MDINKISDGMRIVDSGTAEVIVEPRGDCGLEGYSIRDIIEFRLIFCAKLGSYYRVRNSSFPDGYYETCSMNTFRKYFKTLTLYPVS